MNFELDLDSSVVDWVIEYAPSAGLFDALGIDYSCGGKSLRYECQRQQLDPEQVLQRLLSMPPESPR